MSSFARVGLWGHGSARWVVWLLGLLFWLQARVAVAAPSTVEVLSDAPDRTVLRFDLYDYELAPFMIGDEVATELELRRAARTLRAGAPDLPTVSRSILIAPDAEVAVNVVSASYHEVADILIAPSKGNLTRDVDPDSVPFNFGPDYQQAQVFPGELATLGQPYLLRGYRGIAVSFQPFQYNPQARSLRVYDSITVEVVRTGLSQLNVLPASANSNSSRAFRELASRHFLNHGSKAAYSPLDEEGSLLIIAHDAYLPNVQPLVAHKNAIGIPTTAVGISTVGNSAGAIKSYLQSQYGAGNLAFVLLVGDATQVATPYAAGGAADPTYAKLAGNDNYPDVIVGRFSASSGAHVDTQVARTIEYETNQAPAQPWFRKAIGIGSEEGPGDDNQYDYEHIDEIRTKLLGAGFTQVDKFYGYDADATDVVNALNQGRGLINYCGHGSPTQFGTTGFSTYEVPQLDNAGMLPFVLSVACNAGEFDTGTCLGEAMMRSTSGGEATGAIAVYASSISQSWNPPMEAQDEFNDLFIAGTYSSLGTLFYAGSAQMMDAYGADGAAMFSTWHLFGDPSLQVVGSVEPASGMSVTPEEGLAASGPEAGPFDPGSKSYTLQNVGDAPIAFSVSGAPAWLTVNPSSGTIEAGSSVEVVVALGGTANGLLSGQYNGHLTITNETTHEGDTQRSVSLSVGEPESVHRWPLDTNPGWVMEGAWAFGQPMGAGSSEDLGFPDPTSGYTGNSVLGFNLNGDYENDLPETNLTTTAIDCSEVSNAKLSFWRWLNLEGAEYDHAYVKVSNDGASWTTVWQNAQDITDNQWSLVELDISAIADGQPTVYLRWTMGATDGGLVGSGWNLDDIEISGFQSQGCGDGDVDGDGDPTPPCGGGDCNDQDPTVHWGGQEFCDGLDNDCDGEVDEACNGENPTGGPGPDDAEQELSNGDLRGTYCGLAHDADGRALAWSWLLVCSALLLRKRRA